MAFLNSTAKRFIFQGFTDKMALDFATAMNSLAEDRFSTLPKVIIHHIFSFLNANDMGRVSILSKTYRQFCLSSPYLNFESEHLHCNWKCRIFSSCLNSLMTEREDQYMHSFRLNWVSHREHDNEKERSRLNSWLNKAGECNVQELNLNLKVIFFSSNSLLNCSNSLRVLKLNLSGGKLELPDLVFGSLQMLSLTRTDLKDDFLLGKWTSTFCPSLKKVELLRLYKIKVFENHNIEDLTIKFYHNVKSGVTIFGDSLKLLSLRLPTDSSSRYEKHVTVKICAPNLEVLRWEGNPVDDIDVENFRLLKKGTINIDRSDSRKAKDTFDGLIKLLDSMSSAEHLCLHISLIEILFITDRMPMKFENLQQLSLILDSWDVCFIKVIASFVSKLPNLTTLVIRRAREKEKTNYPYETSHCGWEDEIQKILKYKSSKYYKNLKRSWSSRFALLMKKLEIEIAEEDDNNSGIKLVDYFLKNGKCLNDVTISYPSCDSLERLSALTGTLVTASSNVVISSVMKPLQAEIVNGSYYWE